MYIHVAMQTLTYVTVACTARSYRVQLSCHTVGPLHPHRNSPVPAMQQTNRMAVAGSAMAVVAFGGEAQQARAG
jgi:hypothetical protein